MNDFYYNDKVRIMRGFYTGAIGRVRGKPFCDAYIVVLEDTTVVNPVRYCDLERIARYSDRSKKQRGK